MIQIGQLVALGEGDLEQTGQVRDTEFTHQPRAMDLYRAMTDPEQYANLLVRQAAHETGYNVSLSGRQYV
jgi:hypothetical protein